MLELVQASTYAASIDNLMKGQSGNAMQNLNVMFGYDQRAGLDRPPLYP